MKARAQQTHRQSFEGEGLGLIDLDGAEVRVLGQGEAVTVLGITPAKTVKMVAFESTNKVTNTGEKAWEKEIILVY
mgnify:CR=1 FL=1